MRLKKKNNKKKNKKKEKRNTRRKRKAANSSLEKDLNVSKSFVLLDRIQLLCSKIQNTTEKIKSCNQPA